ncbi:MAG: AEC family transporter [Candidatus Kaelpia aquatica]|nr:AEC family transporter [Candidatus Kaelpia aquatica]
MKRGGGSSPPLGSDIYVMESLNFNIGLWKALFETALLVLAGYISLKIGIFKDNTAKDLTKFIIYVTLPALIFYSFSSHLNRANLGGCSLFFLASLIIFLIGFVVGLISTKSLVKREDLKREFVLLNAFQNSGYLPLALVGNLFSPAKSEIAYLYIFSYLMGFNLVMLSFGFYYMHASSKMKLKSFITPAFVASILGIAFALSGLTAKIPGVVIQPIYKLGSTTVPLSMVMLGMILAQSRLFKLEYLKELSVLIFSKLLFIPLVVLVLLKFIKLDSFSSFLILLQAAMPSATTLSLIAHFKGAHTEFVSQGIMYTHIFLILTLPLIFLLF